MDVIYNRRISDSVKEHSEDRRPQISIHIIEQQKLKARKYKTEKMRI